MTITTYSNFRQNLKSFLDQVQADRTPLYVTRAKSEDVVVLTKADYEGMKETLYLLSSPPNAERINQGIEQYKQGLAVERELIEE